MGDYDAALAMEMENVSLLPPDDKVNLAIHYNNLSDLQLAAGKTSQAIESLNKARELAAAPEAWRIRIVITMSLAEVKMRGGRMDEADKLLTEALELAREKKIPEFESAAQRLRAEMFLKLGGPAALFKGAVAAEDSVRVAREAHLMDRIFNALFTRAKVLGARGDLADAAKDFDEALLLGEQLRADGSRETSDLKGAFENVLPLYRASVENLIARGLPGEALQRAEQAKARVLMDILLRGGVDESYSLSPAEVSERTRLRNLVRTTKDDSASTALRQFERGLYAHHPERSLQSASFEAAGPAQMKLLVEGGHKALLDYFLVPSGVILFVVREESAVSATLLPDPAHNLDAEIRRFRLQLAKRDLDYKPTAKHLFDRLLGPAIADLKETTEWTVSPDGALWEVPFEALIDGAGRHVMETRAIAFAPSLTVAAHIAQSHPASAAAVSLLALGNPRTQGTPLPDAAREVERIGADFAGQKPVVLTGASASLAQFRERAPQAGIIHLAAHASLNDYDPLASYVALSGTGGDDGMLTARDILDMHLHADLVVLSGCETALGKAAPGEGMIGMGWALSAAGASSSVLSYWKIDSAASMEFMTAFYRRMRTAPQGASKAALLRSAALEIMASPGHRHPFYWAAFTLWGSGL